VKKTIVVIPMKEKKALEMKKTAKHVSFIENVGGIIFVYCKYNIGTKFRHNHA
jgi:hypothetical protein